MWVKCADGNLVNLDLVREVTIVEQVNTGVWAFYGDGDCVSLFEGDAATCARIHQALQLDLAKGASFFNVNDVLELAK